MALDIADIFEKVGILSNYWYYNKNLLFCYMNVTLALIE